MRWPWRRKPRSHDPSMAIDWSAFGEPDARFAKWMEHHCTHEPDCQSCAESCTEPDNQQVSGNRCGGLFGVARPSIVLAEPEYKSIPLTLGDLQTSALADILADATETITNPYSQETTMTTPEPVAESREEVDRRLADIVRDVRDAALPGFTTQIDGVKIAKCDTRGQTSGERAAYQRGLHEAAPGRQPHWDDLNDWEVNVLGMARDIAASDNPRTTAQVYTGEATTRIVITAEDHLRSRLTAEYQRGRAEGADGVPLWLLNVTDAARAITDDGYQHRSVTTPDGTRLFLLTEAELDRRTELPEQPEPGTAAWLRDLADRVRVSTDYTDADGDTEDEMESALRTAAERVEREERQTARDTRDRERVEQIVLRQWETAARTTVDAALASLGEVTGVDIDTPAPEYDVAGFWATLTDEQKAEALAPALELYRAGRDDQEADRG